MIQRPQNIKQHRLSFHRSIGALKLGRRRCQKATRESDKHESESRKARVRKQKGTSQKAEARVRKQKGASQKTCARVRQQPEKAHLGQRAPTISQMCCSNLKRINFAILPIYCVILPTLLGVVPVNACHMTSCRRKKGGRAAQQSLIGLAKDPQGQARTLVCGPCLGLGRSLAASTRLQSPWPNPMPIIVLKS